VKYLITGGCGFLGANLSASAMERGHALTVFDNLSRTGSAENLKWLQSRGAFHLVEKDIRDKEAVEASIRSLRPDVVFHLAGQVAMTTSLSDPRQDFEINVVGGNNLLEAVREFSPASVVIYSSTNKVYGDLEHISYVEEESRYRAPQFPNGFDESLGLAFSSPYGCSKGATDQYMLDYARVFGLKTIVFRHSSIYGGRQYSTADQGWIGWFVKQAIEFKKNPEKAPFDISGDGKQVRDALFVTDIVDCYFKAPEKIERAKGQAFNIGGGMSNSLSLVELFSDLEREIGTTLRFTRRPWRQSDQKVFVADIAKAFECFGWKPTVSKSEGLRQMISWVGSHV
jgi:CDP-paratose 2-epimerase